MDMGRVTVNIGKRIRRGIERQGVLLEEGSREQNGGGSFVICCYLQM